MKHSTKTRKSSDEYVHNEIFERNYALMKIMGKKVKTQLCNLYWCLVK